MSDQSFCVWCMFGCFFLSISIGKILMNMDMENFDKLDFAICVFCILFFGCSSIFFGYLSIAGGIKR